MFWLSDNLKAIKYYFMKYYFLIIVFFIALTTSFQSCKKNANARANTTCFPNDSTTRQILDKQATIKSVEGKFYIVEQNTIDTKLSPCNLAKNFQVDNLQVTISGDVKATVLDRSAPCCVDNFFITKITR